MVTFHNKMRIMFIGLLVVFTILVIHYGDIEAVACTLVGLVGLAWVLFEIRSYAKYIIDDIGALDIERTSKKNSTKDEEVYYVLQMYRDNDWITVASNTFYSVILAEAEKVIGYPYRIRKQVITTYSEYFDFNGKENK